MEMLKVTLNNTCYEYVDSITYQNKQYVALSNGVDITINEYRMVNGQIELIPLDDVTFHQVQEVMHL